MSLQILRINTKYNVLYLAGGVTPGPNHCYTAIFDSVLPLRRRLMQTHAVLLLKYLCNVVIAHITTSSHAKATRVKRKC